MNNNKKKACYQLLQNVLLDAFNVSAEYFTPPYQDINKIDQGMRATVWTNYNDLNTKINFGEYPGKYRILIIKSNLGFYNILAILGSGKAPDFISVGPFRNEELSPNYFTEIMKESHISPKDIQGLKYIYERMPVIHVDVVVNVTKHILSTFIPEFTDIIPESLQYAEQKRTVEVNTALLEKNSLENSSQYQELLFSFLSFLKSGDNISAKKALQHFLHKTNMASSKNMQEYKLNMQILNNYCHMALLQTSIHPYHVLKQAESLRVKIDHMTSLNKLEQIPNEICRKYCLLVKNYTYPEYSRLTKDVIAYIQLHLEEELSLSHLASYFNRNASALSNTFSKEAGQSLTSFIHQVRIQEAIRLFNTTHMSVSEVAVTVGYQDFSYFSKVFSKHVGCSPRDYKQKSFENIKEPSESM